MSLGLEDWHILLLDSIVLISERRLKIYLMVGGVVPMTYDIRDNYIDNFHFPTL